LILTLISFEIKKFIRRVIGFSPILFGVHPYIYVGHKLSFQFRNEQFFARSRKSRNYAEAYKWYAAQVIPQIDAEIAEKGHFWMDTV